MKRQLLIGFLLTISAIQAESATLYSPPVALNPPAIGVKRSAWCVAQNLEQNKKKADQQVISVQIFGKDGQPIGDAVEKLLPSGTVTWLAGSDGSGLAYCKFTVKNKNTLRAYITLQDVRPGGNPATDYATVLMLEAR